MTQSSTLNPEQTQAVNHGDGPLLIIAGAGTGKTTVVTERIKHLILDKEILPSQILALTFTEKAAREMEERIDKVLPYGYTQMWISTYHAFCDRILRAECIQIGLDPTYKLLTEAQNVLFLRKNLFHFELEYFRPMGNPYKFIGGLLQHFSRLKDEDISPENYITWTNEQSEENKTEEEILEIQKNKELAKAYKVYEELKIKEGVMDYGDLIANVLKLFRVRKNILKQYQDLFKYILVDEFQDTNFAQNQLAILLAGKTKNITVVGDDDQAIYRWRGAAISNMIQFREHFPDVKIVTLTKNYRSTQEILNNSYKVIQFNNPDRLEIKENINKKLESVRNIKGAPIEFIFNERVEDEAESVVQTIIELAEKKHILFKDMAILVRANEHANPFIRSLTLKSIPYQFLGPGHLFHQEEIKDLISYLKVLYDFQDSVSLYRVLNMSIFSLESRDIALFLNVSRRKNSSLFEILEKISDSEDFSKELNISDEIRDKIKNFVAMVKRHLSRISKDSAGQILYYFFEDSGLLKQILKVSSESESQKSQNIAKFFQKLKTYETENTDSSVFSVIDWIDLSMQMGESPLAADTDWSENNAVNILTIHSSKGLEFPVVFLVNLVTQRFPTRERKDQIPIPQDVIKEILPEGDFHLQEERRLFYVGMTRAKDYLFLTAAHYYGEGKRERKFSPFLLETFGEDKINSLLTKEKSKRTIFQPTLLDWAEQFTQSSQITKLHETKPMQIPQINYISYSQIQCYSICPLHYKLKYMLKIPGEVTSAQSFGISIHSALRDYYQKIIQNESVSKEAIIEFLERQWISAGYKNRNHEEKALQQAKNILINYINRKIADNEKSAKPISVEIPFQYFVKQTNGDRTLKLGGRIDRVDEYPNGKIEIIDYKTGSNIPTEKKLTEDLQLTFYALAANRTKGGIFNKPPEDILLTLYYLEEEKKLTTTRTKEQLESSIDDIFNKVIEIEQSKFECSGNLLCQNCEYKMICQTY